MQLNNKILDKINSIKDIQGEFIDTIKQQQILISKRAAVHSIFSHLENHIRNTQSQIFTKIFTHHLQNFLCQPKILLNI